MSLNDQNSELTKQEKPQSTEPQTQNQESTTKERVAHSTRHNRLNNPLAEAKENKVNTLNKVSAASPSNIWFGTKKPGLQNTKSISSGFPELDQQLHANGWPLGVTAELGIPQHGVGELRLLIPALRALQQRTHEAQHLIWIAPPFLPFAPSLVKEQIDVRQLTIVQTSTIQDTLWASEQCLLSGCCAAVLCWSGNYNLSTRELRRLQLAAEKSGSWNVLIRDQNCLSQSSASGLRIRLKSDSYSKLKLKIIKQPGGWGGQRLTLSLPPHYENWQRLPVSLLPHHNKRVTPVAPEQLNTLNQSLHQQASVTVLTSVSVINTVH